MNYKNFFKSKVQSFKNEGYYRKFLPVKRSRSTFPYTQVEIEDNEKNTLHKKENIKIWCTNDYLNMSHNEEVIETMISTIQDVGTGSGGTRNISGTSSYHVKLEMIISLMTIQIFNCEYVDLGFGQETGSVRDE